MKNLNRIEACNKKLEGANNRKQRFIEWLEKVPLNYDSNDFTIMLAKANFLRQIIAKAKEIL